MLLIISMLYASCGLLIYRTKFVSSTNDYINAVASYVLLSYNNKQRDSRRRLEAPSRHRAVLFDQC